MTYASQEPTDNADWDNDYSDGPPMQPLFGPPVDLSDVEVEQTN